MFEYKILRTSVSDAEVEINYLALQGWRVISTALATGSALTVNSTPLIVTLEREHSNM